MEQKIKLDENILGKNLKRLRKNSKLTQEQVVARLQIRGLPTTRSIYNKIEMGISNIRVTELMALKEIYGVEYDEFFMK